MTRSFSTFFDTRQLQPYLKGVMTYKYRGVLCNKSPIDIAIYLRLLDDQKPLSIIEIGSKLGGSALLLRDITRMMSLTCEIISIDLKRPPIASKTEGIKFIKGDAHDLNSIFLGKLLSQLPHPWLVIEDSAHTFNVCTAVLEFCAKQLFPGEYLVMEDGVLDELGLSEKYRGGPNRAIKKFLADFPGVFEIDKFYCDMFGQNATFNPNGYLKKT